MGKYFASDAAEKKLLHSAASMRCHYDEITARVGRGLDNAFGWMFVFNVPTVAWNIVLLCDIHGVVEDLLSVSF